MFRRVLLLAFLLNFISPLFSMTATEIIKKSEDAVRGRTQMGVFEITIKTRKWTRTMKMKSWEQRKGRKSFSEITAPKKDAGNRFLLIKNEMRHFIPGLQKAIKISPSMMLQSWMGSDFTNDDIVKESSITKDYHHKLSGSEKVDGFDCYRVELIPKKGAAVVWGKIIYFARKKDSLPVREEFYNQHGVMKKFMTMSEFKNMGGRVIPTLYKMQTVKKKNRYTLMKINYIRFNARIPSRVFTIQNLKRK